MTLAADQPFRRRRRFSGRSTAVLARGEVVVARAPGLAFVAGLTALLGAWAAIAVFVGPDFGWRPTTIGSWQWVMANWLLHLIPGAAAFAAGLIALARAPARRVGPSALLALAAIVVIAAGFWLVIGPAVWPLFRSTDAFNPLVSTNRAFLDQIGSSLGPGLLLAALGGMALKAAITRPKMDATIPAKHEASSVETPTGSPSSTWTAPPAPPAPASSVEAEPPASGPSTDQPPAQ